MVAIDLYSVCLVESFTLKTTKKRSKEMRRERERKKNITTFMLYTFNTKP